MRNSSPRVVGALLAAAALLSALSACAGTTPEPDDPEVPPHVGTWGSDEDGAAHVTFEADGSVHGFDGCADLDGNWTMGEDGTVFTDALGTSAAECDAPEAWLSETAYVEVDGGRLVVKAASEDELGRLGRVG